MAISTTHTSHDRPAGPNERAVGAASAGVGLISLAFANFAGSGGDGGTGPFLVTAAFTLVAAAVVFGWAVPRALTADTQVRTAVVLTVLGVLGLAVFWSGLTQVTAPAAALLAYVWLQRPDAPRAGAIATIAVSTLAYLVAIVACIAG